MGRVLKDTLVGTLDMEAPITGKGLNPAVANFYLDASVQNLGLNQYNYDSIWV